MKQDKIVPTHWLNGDGGSISDSIDKYGLRWQVLPKNILELLLKPDSFKIIMDQKKIVTAEYLK